jgi:ribosomal protein S18 acetylase RimI-like enzyme
LRRSGEDMLRDFSITLSVAIRPAHERDLPNLEWFGMFRSCQDEFRKIYEHCRQGSTIMLVAEANHFPVGRVWIDLLERKEARTGILLGLRVMPPLQRLGIGTLLIKSAEMCLKVNGYKIAQIGVEKSNSNAKRLYERLGYQIVGESIEEWHYTTVEGNITQVILDEWTMQRVIE